MEDEISEKHGKHWYLSNLIVAKAFQGKGVGSIMLDWGLRRADEDGLPVFCLSSAEVRVEFFEFTRFGWWTMRGG